MIVNLIPFIYNLPSINKKLISGEISFCQVAIGGKPATTIDLSGEDNFCTDGPPKELTYARSTVSSRAKSPTKTDFTSLFNDAEPEFLTSSLEGTSPSKSEASSPTLSAPDPTVTIRQERPQAIAPTHQSSGTLPLGGLPSGTSASLTSLNPAIPTTRMEGITESVPTFHGKRDGYEDPTEYLETITFVVEQRYTEPEKAATVKRLVFRSRLREEALAWYQRLEATVRSDWDRLSELFSAEYKLEPRSGPDPNQFFNQPYNLKQGQKPIA